MQSETNVIPSKLWRCEQYQDPKSEAAKWNSDITVTKFCPLRMNVNAKNHFETSPFSNYKWMVEILAEILSDFPL